MVSAAMLTKHSDFDQGKDQNRAQAAMVLVHSGLKIWGDSITLIPRNTFSQHSKIL